MDGYKPVDGSTGSKSGNAKEPIVEQGNSGGRHMTPESSCSSSTNATTRSWPSPRGLLKQAKDKGNKLFHKKSTETDQKSDDKVPHEKKSLSQKVIKPITEKVKDAKDALYRNRFARDNIKPLEKGIIEKASSIKKATGKYLTARKEEFKSNVGEMGEGIKKMGSGISGLVGKLQSSVTPASAEEDALTREQIKEQMLKGLEALAKERSEKAVDPQVLGRVNEFSQFALGIFRSNTENKNFEGAFRNSPNVTEVNEISTAIKEGKLTEEQKTSLGTNFILLSGVLSRLCTEGVGSDEQYQGNPAVKENRNEIAAAILEIVQIVCKAHAEEKTQGTENPSMLSPTTIGLGFPTLASIFFSNKNLTTSKRQEEIAAFLSAGESPNLVKETPDQFVRRMSGDLVREDSFVSDFEELIDRYDRGDVSAQYVDSALRNSNIAQSNVASKLREDKVMALINGLGEEKREVFLKGLMSTAITRAEASTSLRNVDPGMEIYTHLMRQELVVAMGGDSEFVKLLDETLAKMSDPPSEKADLAVVAEFIKTIARASHGKVSPLLRNLTDHFIQEQENKGLSSEKAENFFISTLSLRCITPLLINVAAERAEGTKEQALNLTNRKGELQGALSKATSKKEKEKIEAELGQVVSELDKLGNVNKKLKSVASMIQREANKLSENSLGEALKGLRSSIQSS